MKNVVCVFKIKQTYASYFPFFLLLLLPYPYYQSQKKEDFSISSPLCSHILRCECFFHCNAIVWRNDRAKKTNNFHVCFFSSSRMQVQSNSLCPRFLYIIFYGYTRILRKTLNCWKCTRIVGWGFYSIGKCNIFDGINFHSNVSNDQTKSK